MSLQPCTNVALVSYVKPLQECSTVQLILLMKDSGRWKWIERDGISTSPLIDMDCLPSGNAGWFCCVPETVEGRFLGI